MPAGMPGMPASIPQEASFMSQNSFIDQHQGMRRSFNTAPAVPGFPANMPMYRSFDQGSLATFSRYIRSLRLKIPVQQCFDHFRLIWRMIGPLRAGLRSHSDHQLWDSR